MGTDYTNDPRPSPTDEVREYDYGIKRTFVLTITTDYPDGEQAALAAARHAVDRIGWGDATAWYYQGSPGHEQWMAVVAEWEPEDEWFEESKTVAGWVVGELLEINEWPTPRTYPIDQRPPYGHLIYRMADGSEISEPASTDPKDAALAEWRRRAEQAERALDEHEAHEENARRTPKPNWKFPLFAVCNVCGETLQFDVDPGGTPGRNGDWGANGDYGCITGDDEGTDGHTPIKIRWRP